MLNFPQSADLLAFKVESDEAVRLDLRRFIRLNVAEMILRLVTFANVAVFLSTLVSFVFPVYDAAFSALFGEAAERPEMPTIALKIIECFITVITDLFTTRRFLTRKIWT